MPFVARAACGAGAWRNVAGWAYGYGKNFTVSLTIGVVIHLLFDITRLGFATQARVASWKGWQRTVFFSGHSLLGAAARATTSSSGRC